LGSPFAPALIQRLGKGEFMEESSVQVEKVDVKDERDRLESLHRYNVINDDSINFDDLTLLASQICGTPIAMVTLIDADTAWVKSIVGLDLKSVDRKEVFCNQTIEQQDVLVIEDLHLHDHFCDSRFVVDDPNIRFYAGTSLVNKAGYALGTLCVMDYCPRQLTNSQMDSLKALSRQTIQLLEAKLSKDRVKKDFYELQRLSKVGLEQQIKMIHSARMTSLGEMANGVALEVNNPLSVIDHAIEKMNRSHVYDEASVAMIQKAVHRITKIIHGLRYLAQDGSNDPLETISVKNLLANTVELYASRSKEEGIEITLQSSPHHYISARQCQIIQILINLVQNSFHAVSQVKEKWIRLTSLEKEDYIQVCVEDSGKGIELQDQERIFEPFFTLDTHEHISGLGLCISKRLAQENAGDLFLDPNGEATKFVLRLKKSVPVSH
jgi:two-component system, NtrC family, sensor kinase